MPHIAARVDNKTKLQIERYCNTHQMTMTQFFKESLYEKLAGDMLLDETDWKTNAAAMFGINIGQLAYAISNSTSVSEFFGRINAKTDIMEIFSITNPDDIGLQITRNNRTFMVKLQKSGSRIDMIKKLLLLVEEKLFMLDEDFYDELAMKAEAEENDECESQ